MKFHRLLNPPHDTNDLNGSHDESLPERIDDALRRFHPVTWGAIQDSFAVTQARKTAAQAKELAKNIEAAGRTGDRSAVWALMRSASEDVKRIARTQRLEVRKRRAMELLVKLEVARKKETVTALVGDVSPAVKVMANRIRNDRRAMSMQAAANQG